MAMVLGEGAPGKAEAVEVDLDGLLLMESLFMTVRLDEQLLRAAMVRHPRLTRRGLVNIDK